MVFLFFSICLVVSLLFFVPYPLLRPLKQGLFLFSFLLTVLSFVINRSLFYPRLQAFWKAWILREVKHSNLWIRVSVGIILFGFLYHGYLLSQGFASSFQFHDADYVGMQEVVRNLMRGSGYLSSYYSANGEGSYLAHHFSPSLIFFVPFESLGFGRWGYAIGVYFYLSLGTILWTEILLKKKATQIGNGNINLIYLLLIGILTNLYLYRLGTSYHFEVLVYPLSAVLFYYMEKEKISIGLFVSLFAFLFVKEDIAIYTVLFLTPAVVWNGISRFLEEKKEREGKWAIQNIRFEIGLVVLLVSLAYLLFVFFLLPNFFNVNSEHWFGVLTKDYPESYKQVTSLSKSVQIFFELVISGGTGIIFNLPSFVGLLFIYLTHALSHRPWHHEVYSYYCYTIVPFLVFSGIVWMKEKKSLSITIFFLFLTLLFFRNLQDSNFPIAVEQIGLFEEEKRNAKEVTSELDRIRSQNTLSGFPIIFSQYNLSFSLPKEAILYPLNQVSLVPKTCATKECYLVIAPNFTKEALVPRAFIESKRNLFLQGVLVFKGKWIEIWKYKPNASNHDTI